MDTPKLRSFPKPKIMFGRRCCCIFPLRGIYPFGFVHFQGFRGLVIKNKKNITSRPHFALPTSSIPNFSVAKVLATSTQHRLRLKTPRRITCQLPELPGSWVNDDQTHKTGRITKCTFLCQHLNIHPI